MFDFKSEQRKLLLELVNSENVLITEVSSDLDFNDVKLKIHFNNAVDKEKFINDYGLFVNKAVNND